MKGVRITHYLSNGTTRTELPLMTACPGSQRSQDVTSFHLMSQNNIPLKKGAVTPYDEELINREEL